MPTYEVKCRVDAWVVYVAKVKARNAMEAAELADNNPDDYNWEEHDVEQFDARSYVTLDKSGADIEETQTNFG